jgi:ELWxxDGT repeat protein
MITVTRVADIRSGSVGSAPQHPALLGHVLFFAASDGSTGRELWRSDGTAAGTIRVADLLSGEESSNPEELIAIGNRLIFTAEFAGIGRELWASDGTENGTVLVLDINKNNEDQLVNSNNYSGLYPVFGSYPEQLTNVSNSLFFTADDQINGRELWKSDGSREGTILLANIRSGRSSSNPERLTPAGETLFFRANDGSSGSELWKSDGTATGTNRVADISVGAAGSYPDELTVIEETLFFSARNREYGQELWRSDGTPEGTQRITDIRSGPSGSYPKNLTAVGNALFFTATNGSSGVELWKSDGTAAGTILVADINTGQAGFVVSSEPQWLTAVGNSLFFTADEGNGNRELWTSDGTRAGTRTVLDIRPGHFGSVPQQLTPVDDAVVFTADDGSSGLELWISDGTAAGTKLLADIQQGSATSQPYILARVGDTVFFRATDGSTGPELWRVSFGDSSRLGSVLISPQASSVTSESGGISTLTVVLTTQPSADVKINLISSDPNEGAPSSDSLTFTPDNWSIAQTFSVRGVDDAIDDGNILYSIHSTAISDDPAYNDLKIADVTLSNSDDDSAGMLISPSNGLFTSEPGGSATFSTVLTSQPLADVRINLVSTHSAEGSPSSPSITFTQTNWHIPQTVTVTGVDDDANDGDVAYAILTAAAISSDPSYDGLNAEDVQLTNINDDIADITLSTTGGLVTTEGGGSATFSMVLDTAPKAEVHIGLSSSDPGEGTPSFSALTFTPENWNIPQIVTVTGVDDAETDGDATYSILIAAASSNDPDYNGLNASDVTVTNIDNDVPPPLRPIAVGGTSRNEGNTGSTRFGMRVTRRGDTSEASSVDFRVEGSSNNAASASDFIGNRFLDGTISFAPGEIDKTVTFHVRADRLVEPDEGFKASIFNPSAGWRILRGSLSYTVLNDDKPRRQQGHFRDRLTGAGHRRQEFTLTPITDSPPRLKGNEPASGISGDRWSRRNPRGGTRASSRLNPTPASQPISVAFLQTPGRPVDLATGPTPDLGAGFQPISWSQPF